MDNKVETIVIDMNAPAISAEYHFGLGMYCISHGEWSEWVGREEWWERVKAEEVKLQREKLIEVLSARRTGPAARRAPREVFLVGYVTIK